ncbi:hypothetical protein Nepgr_010854 [Nepenthes gracilis]|uniref:Transcriptional regulator SLK2 n=1 Tax=Nepenthes gracilis TaxID=150966 RepID=A0AAD3XLQ5_NEPGR|nr:hypothetical protein Nepgr_010854 [Nepenthes gracilis]
MESYLDSSHQGAVPPMAPARMDRGLTQSSMSSGIFFQGAEQSQDIVNSHMSSPFGNFVNLIPGSGCSNLGPVSGDVKQTILNSVANSGPSVGASSLVTDANSAFSGGPQLQRSASINTESYLRLPASPMSFSSTNISVSGSSIIDGSSTVPQNSQHDPSSQGKQNQHQLHHGASSATSLPASQTGQTALPVVPRIPSSFIQDPTSLSQIQKKPRLDIKQEDILQQQVMQQLLQRQDPTQLQGHNPQLQAFIQQQQRLQQQQFLQAMPQFQRAQLQQRQQQQLRHHLQQQSIQQMASMKSPYDTGGVCARRLMQYLYRQWQRPTGNTIAFWRKFVSEFYALGAKKRWCLSLYENVGHHALGAFPQATMDAWHCEICGSRSGRGFEATFEVLPRLNEVKFGSGVKDELLFVDLPRERRSVSGMMILEYAKAVQESVYEQLRVVREGQLRIIFTQELKILSWEFCARRHEELLPRTLVAPQVNQLLQVVQKCQSTIADSGSEGVSSEDLQANSNMIVTAGRQLAKILDLQSLNDLGFSKRYVRCLQIAEVVNITKDLIDFCGENKVGPIDALKNYPRHASTSKLQMQKMQEMEQLPSMQGLLTSRSTVDKTMGTHYAINNQRNSNHDTVSRATLSGSAAAAALAFSSYQNMLIRQNSSNSLTPISFQQEASSSNNSNQSHGYNLSRSSQNLQVNGFSSPHQLQQHALNSNGLLQQTQQHAHQSSQDLQQKMIQQLLQDTSSNNGPSGQKNSVSGQIGNRNSAANGFGFGNNETGKTAAKLSKNNSFKSVSGSNSPATGGGSHGFNQKATELPHGHRLADEMVPDITHDFDDNGFFTSDLDDAMGYGWKA